MAARNWQWRYDERPGLKRPRQTQPWLIRTWTLYDARGAARGFIRTETWETASWVSFTADGQTKLDYGIGRPEAYARAVVERALSIVEGSIALADKQMRENWGPPSLRR
jgi:hypothetical protein